MAQSAFVQVALVIGLAVGAQVLAWRLRVPAILLLLGAGLLAGPGLGFLGPDTLGAGILPLASIAVAILLFEGGLTLRWKDVQDTSHAVRNLVTAGVAVSVLLTTWAAYAIVGLPLGISILLGSLLSVSGPTVVGPILRQVRPETRMGNLLRWEGIVVDPIGAVLAVLAFEVMVEQGPGLQLAVGHGSRLILGAIVIGLAGAGVLVAVLRRHLVPDHLEVPTTLAVVILVFVAADITQSEGGLLAVTIMGAALANQNKVPVRHIHAWKEQFSTILIGVLFVVLAARLRPEDLWPIRGPELIFLGFLFLIQRPATVFISTLGTGTPWRQRLWLASVMPRGIVAVAVASVLGLRLEEANVPGADRIVPLTVLVVIATVLVYGLGAGPLARRLGLAQKDPQGVLVVGANAATRTIAHAIMQGGRRVLLVDRDRQAVAAATTDGLDAIEADILSQAILEDIDLGGIGHFWSITPNDDVNSLACIHFQEVFPKPRRCHIQAAEERDDDLLAKTLWPGIDYGGLRQRIKGKWEIRRTSITPKFSLDDHAREHPAAIPLWVEDGGRIRPFRADYRPEVNPGATLVALTPPRDGTP